MMRKKKACIGELCGSTLQRLVGSTSSGRGPKHFIKNVEKEYFSVRHSYVLITSDSLSEGISHFDLWSQFQFSIRDTLPSTSSGSFLLKPVLGCFYHPYHTW
jgi:hypothetical protein